MALPLGRWQPTATPSPGAERARGYHIWQAYSPWVSLAQIVSKYLKALGNAQRLKVFFNTVLGQTYEEPGQRVDQAGLQKRAEQSATPYEQLEIPARVLALTAGVDVQPDRIALVIRGWGPGQESWLILWEEIHGDTSREEVWGRLGDVLTARYTTQDGRELPIALAAVDTGHNTQEAYAFCRRYPRVAMAIKGSSKRGEPICASRPSAKDVSYRGETIKRGVKLWLLGTDTAKDWIHNRLKVQQPGPGYWHFPLGVGEDYYRQITSEKKETRFVNGFPLRIWTKKDGDRNEALDCEVYALAAIVRLGLDRGLLKRLEKKRPKKGQETTEAKARQAEPVEAGEEEPASMETFPAPEVELDTETEAEVQPTLKRPVGQARVRPPRRRGWMGGL
jgi:phage terminase large subunit GpA-like protein